MKLKISTWFSIPVWMLIADKLFCPNQSPLISGHSKAVRFVLSKPVTTDFGSFSGCTFCLVQTSHRWFRVILRLYVLSCPNQSPLISGHSKAVRFVLSKPVTTDVGSFWGCMFCLVHTSHHWFRVILRLYVLSCPNQSPLMSGHSKAVRFVLSTPVTTDIGSFWGRTFCLVQTSHVLSCPHQSPLMSGHSEAVRFVLSKPVTTDVGSFWGCTFLCHRAAMQLTRQ